MATSNAAKWNHASTYQRDLMTRLREEIVGVCGEMAFCKGMRRFWSPSVNTFHAIADVGENIEIRSTDRDDGSLIIRENDDPDRWYVLVTGNPPEMTIRGCIRGADALQDQWLRNPHGHRLAWFVPQAALRPPKGEGRLGQTA
jgi:hypothetical protein